MKIFYKIKKLEEELYEIKKFDSFFNFLESTITRKEENKIVEKFVEFEEPKFNYFWYNSKGKLNWEIQ